MSTTAEAVKHEPLKVRFLGQECDVHFGLYAEGGKVAIQLTSAEGPMGKATTNILRLKLAPHEVIVKSVSENEGMYEALLEAGVIEPAHAEARIGFMTCPICFLTEAGVRQAREAGLAV